MLRACLSAAALAVRVLVVSLRGGEERGVGVLVCGAPSGCILDFGFLLLKMHPKPMSFSS
jgi:hypothetical protein